ncbi:hypothetical protein AVEN_102657-1 [Araneus ventricosus]|uniref:Uncharacterized protein n=1 Tax=Araneus ventricosus TaxID=182803 RepID=A0A4Y2HYL4_ARAVE|nr:hypothetical protein AVEN_102657-1 [Araneus ventricosus]
MFACLALEGTRWPGLDFGSRGFQVRSPIQLRSTMCVGLMHVRHPGWNILSVLWRESLDGVAGLDEAFVICPRFNPLTGLFSQPSN